MEPVFERKSVVALGYAAHDRLLVVGKYPDSGFKTRIISSFQCPGGQAATAAAALSKWGCISRFVGRVGDDAEGRLSIESLAFFGVDHDSALMTPGIPTQNATIIIDELSGERTIFWQRHPELDLKVDDLKPEWFDRVDALLLDGHEIEADLAAIRMVKKNDAIVLLDAEELGDNGEKLLKSVDICVASADFGRRTFHIESPREVVRKLRMDYRISTAAVTLGENGVIADWGQGLQEFPGIRVSVKDTTGAGDIFHAGVLMGVISGFEFPRIFGFANVCAALSCRDYGGRKGIPDIREILWHLQ